MGTLAHMLRTICRMPWSLSELLSRPTGLGDRRYALRTCIDEGILPYGRADDPVCGGGLLAAISQAERYLAAHTPDAP